MGWDILLTGRYVEQLAVRCLSKAKGLQLLADGIRVATHAEVAGGLADPGRGGGGEAGGGVPRAGERQAGAQSALGAQLLHDVLPHRHLRRQQALRVPQQEEACAQRGRESFSF